MIICTGHWNQLMAIGVHQACFQWKIIHPKKGSLTPGNGTQLVLHSDRHYAALFALDAVNDHVIHKGGRFAHPKGGSPNPGDNTKVELHSDVHDAMRFKFVSPTNPNEEVLVYGYPTMGGKWKIINMVKDPKAEHTVQLEVSIGKSNTESSTSSFQYSWEVSGGLTVDIFEASASQSLQYMIEKTSSTTWTEETTKTTTIKVMPGKTVVTWQYVFDVEQNASKSVFRSNLLADTESEQDEPKDLQYNA
ncbi:uncharacterized protein [Amphiura filiformis]|uniref:uncharacterized protein n=1 Tax=Amphiura filiformis TaxID=82378 RepID=UPI003B21BC9E